MTSRFVHSVHAHGEHLDLSTFCAPSVVGLERLVVGARRTDAALARHRFVIRSRGSMRQGGRLGTTRALACFVRPLALGWHVQKGLVQRAKCEGVSRGSPGTFRVDSSAQVSILVLPGVQVSIRNFFPGEMRAKRRGSPEVSARSREGPGWAVGVVKLEVSGHVFKSVFKSRFEFLSRRNLRCSPEVSAWSRGSVTVTSRAPAHPQAEPLSRTESESESVTDEG